MRTTFLMATMIALLHAILGSGARSAELPPCFSPPTLDPNNSWLTYNAVNNCGTPITIHYTVREQGGRSSKTTAYVAACSKSQVYQGFKSSTVFFDSYEWNPAEVNKSCSPQPKATTSPQPPKSNNPPQSDIADRLKRAQDRNTQQKSEQQKSEGDVRGKVQDTERGNQKEIDRWVADQTGICNENRVAARNACPALGQGFFARKRTEICLNRADANAMMCRARAAKDYDAQDRAKKSLDLLAESERELLRAERENIRRESQPGHDIPPESEPSITIPNIVIPGQTAPAQQFRPAPPQQVAPPPPPPRQVAPAPAPSGGGGCGKVICR